MQVAGAVRKPLLIQKHLPLRALLSLEATGSIHFTLHEVEVATHDGILGGVGQNGSTEILNHAFLHQQLVLLRG